MAGGAGQEARPYQQCIDTGAPTDRSKQIAEIAGSTAVSVGT
jgi:hypothetical protein